MYGGLSIYNEFQAGIYKDYKRHLSLVKPNWGQIAEGQKTDNVKWDQYQTQSWYFYNWIEQNYPKFNRNTMYVPLNNP